VDEIFKNLALAGDTWVLYLLLGASVISIGIMVERFLTFSKAKGDMPALMDALAGLLEKHDISGAMKLAEFSSRIEARVALKGLQSFDRGHAAVEEVMSSRWLREKMVLEKHLIVLGTLGNNAPFIGLFGTVLGIIKAFNDLAITGQSGVTVVMSGISSALIATAFGILVAIPAVVANNYFATRLKQIQTSSEGLSHILLAYLKEERA
jgi:biopolymer transport protein ExbB